MAKKIIGVILMVSALVTVLLGVKAGAGAPANQKIIERAVVVEDGKVLPENEGEVVLVHGILTATLPFVDEETGVELDSIAAYRRVEKLSIDKAVEEDEKDTWSWIYVSNKDAYGGSGKLIAPDAALGDFLVDDALMQAIGTNKQRTEYSSSELSALGWNDFEDKGIVYLYKGDMMPKEDAKVSYKSGILGKKSYDYLDYLDTYRVRYDVIDTGTNMEYTAVGMQKNGCLLEIDEMDMTALVPGHLSVEEMLQHAESEAKTAVIASVAMAVVMAGIGVLIFVRSGKKRS